MSARNLGVIRAASIVAASLAGCGVAFADDPPYSITWYTVNCGGGTSTGGGYSLVSTIGQPVTGVATAGPFTLASGFHCPEAEKGGPGGSDPGSTQIPGDADGNGTVGLSDVAAMINCWGVGAVCNPRADQDRSGVIGLGDIAVVIQNWGRH